VDRPPGIEAFVARHAALVRSFFRRRCASREDAEDLAQEAFCAMVESYPRFRGASAPSTWVWAICRHVLARHLRTKRLRERLAGELETVAASAASAAASAGAAGTYSTGAATAPDEEARLSLDLVLERLGRNDRLLYQCVYVKGLAIAETARLLGRPEGTIKYQLFLLRGRLRDLLSGGGRIEGSAPSPSDGRFPPRAGRR